MIGLTRAILDGDLIGKEAIYHIVEFNAKQILVGTVHKGLIVAEHFRGSKSADVVLDVILDSKQFVSGHCRVLLSCCKTIIANPIGVVKYFGKNIFKKILYFSLDKFIWGMI